MAALRSEKAASLAVSSESSMLLAADSEDPSGVSGDEYPRRRSFRGARWKALTPVLALGLAAAVLFSLRKQAPASSESELVQLQALQPGSYYLCYGTNSCGAQTLQSWRESPASLAAQVDPYLQGVLGIPASVFNPVAQRWGQNPPKFRGAAVGLSSVAAFMKQLLTSDPFGTGQQVPYLTFHEKGEGQVVVITQKQLAFIVANVIMGNNIPAGNGLSATIRRCSAKGAEAFVYSLLSLLAVLSQELATGLQGSSLVAAVPRKKDDSWKYKLDDQGNLVVQTKAHQELGYAAGDFMAGGIYEQAMTDIAGTVVGGGAALCALADSQDESLVQFYSEVLAFAFFAPPGKMLPVPWLLLGARRYMGTLTGESDRNGAHMDRCGYIAETNWLNDGISSATTQVVINGEPRALASSSFVAVASVCSGSSGGCRHDMAINNNCDSQRRHADEDIRRWVQAFEPMMYPVQIQGAIRSVIRKIGTGPWGAGVWWGDSQQYFLTVLLATSLLSHHPILDYYIYDHFCENPGNQCFVLGGQGCSSCIAKSQAKGIMPGRCGAASVFEMIQRFSGQPAKHLYLALRDVGKPPSQVFDLVRAWQPTKVELSQPIIADIAPPPPPPPLAPAAPATPVLPGQAGVVESPVPVPAPVVPAPAPIPPVGVPVPAPQPPYGQSPYGAQPEPEPPYGETPGVAPAPAPAVAPAVPAYSTPPQGHCPGLTLHNRRYCFHWPWR